MVVSHPYLNRLLKSSWCICDKKFVKIGNETILVFETPLYVYMNRFRILSLIH